MKNTPKTPASETHVFDPASTDPVDAHAISELAQFAAFHAHMLRTLPDKDLAGPLPVFPSTSRRPRH